jgi:hypothetical protein
VAITGNITGNLSGSVGSVTGLTASNLDATISSRLASASYTAPDNTSITAIKAKTDNLPASPAAVGSAMTLTVAYDAAKTAAQAGDAMTLTLAYDAAKTAASQTSVDAIKASTDNLPSDPADESLIIAATDAIMARLGAPSGASVSADIGAVKSDTAAVKTKTDSLTFTVAGQVDANIQYVNDTQVNGDGSGTPWGP